LKSLQESIVDLKAQNMILIEKIEKLGCGTEVLMNINSSKPVLYTPPPDSPFDLNWLEGCAIPQSMQFMIDCLPTIRDLFRGWHREIVLKVLDIGTGNGAGANLLATLHKANFFNVQMKVDALEITNIYKAYAEYHFPNINYIVGDIFTLEPQRKWDLITCSHVIEHLPNPFPLIAEIRRRARHWALFYAPFEERNLLEKGHLISITRSMVVTLQPKIMKIITSPAWKHPVDENSQCVLFVLSGTERLEADFKE
jgi:SAM-dependent methyltransferase